MVSLEKEIVKTDVLVIGGGPAGLMAAIRAADLGVKDVVLADKGNTLRSGNGGGGNDHFFSYIPEYHGNDTKPVLDSLRHSLASFEGRSSFEQTWLDRSFEMVKIWESWGIDMTYQGKREFAGHNLPGLPNIFLKYAGGEQKPVLTEQAKKNGVRIMNRVTLFELLKEGDRVTGALGYDTLKDRVIEFHAKTVFLGTGCCCRLYKGFTSLMFNMPNCPFNTGDGRAMAFRTGAALMNLEFTGRWAGPKNFARAGKGTWIGVLTDSSGNPVGPFASKPDRHRGDIIADAYPQVFDDYMKSGRGPVYMDCRAAPEEDLDYMTHWLRHEGNEGLLDFLEEEGIDFRRHIIEFGRYEPILTGGLLYNNQSETTVKGLYAAGDENQIGMPRAVIWGWIAGENMAEYVKTAGFGNPKNTEEQVGDGMALVKAILGRKTGADWKDANMAIQEIMSAYVGLTRSETLLDQASRNLSILKEKIPKSLFARNGHDLGRCFEVLNLLDLGEAVIFAAMERKESRRSHHRTDYPFANPLLDMQLLVTRKHGDLVGDWKKLD
ncbi:FAD-binding protein [Thermodesulfobacteriota bacterium]